MLPIIAKECVLFEVNSINKDTVIRQMVDAFNQNGYLSEKETYYQDVIAREAVFSTFIGYGIGLPHGKSDGVKEAGICVGRLKNPVIWNEETGDQVSLVIMIAVKNEEGNNLHLKILSKLSRQLMHEKFREILRKESQDNVYDTLVRTLEVTALKIC